MEDDELEAHVREARKNAAPQNCFKQATRPAHNRFKLGYKLEARDPRNPSSSCIATVVECIGPRLRLRLDGSDDRNDFWRLVDADDICAFPSGVLIVPPLGFEKSISYWPNFLEKLQKSGDFAPASCFPPSASAPPRNLFKLGHRLEAIDRKNPQLICPATVGDIKNDRLHVTFDGWKGAFDYWCRYDCRDLFPVGWCKSAGHPLQPAGRKERLSGGVTTVPLTEPLHVQTEGLTAEDAAEPAATPSDGSAQTQPRLRLWLDRAAASRSESIRPELLPAELGPAPLQELLRDVEQTCVDAARDPHRVYKRVEQGDSGLTVSYTTGSRSHTRQLIRVTSPEHFWKLLRDFLRRSGCPKIYRGRKPSSWTAASEAVSLVAAESVTEKRIKHASSSSTASMKSVSPVGVAAAKNTPPAEICASLPHDTTAGVPHKRRSEDNPVKEVCEPKTRKPSETAPEQTSRAAWILSSSTVEQKKKVLTESDDVSKWSVADVENYMKNTDPNLAPLAVKFREHEIDGHALLLLTSEMMVKYMHFKLGPAIKMAHIIDRLKRRRYSF